jgi:hypothetical protein
MSTLANEILMETIFEEVLEEWFPEFDEEQCESIAKTRFESMCQ